MQTLRRHSRGRGQECHIGWDTPAGFPIVQEYDELQVKWIQTILGALQLREPPTDLSSRKVDWKHHTSSLTPNFVQSMDAAHMMLTISQLRGEGLRHFAAVHDGFGVHACDVDRLRTVLREQFVAIYNQPVLESFRDRLVRDNPSITDFRMVPAPGQLEIDCVLESEYFFS